VAEPLLDSLTDGPDEITSLGALLTVGPGRAN